MTFSRVSGWSDSQIKRSSSSSLDPMVSSRLVPMTMILRVCDRDMIRGMMVVSIMRKQRDREDGGKKEKSLNMITINRAKNRGGR